jgi:hypothetical protein
MMIMMTVMLMGHECKRETVWRGLSGMGWEKGENGAGRTEVHYKDGIMKPTKNYLKRREAKRVKEYNRGGRLVQSTLHTSVELPQ